MYNFNEKNHLINIYTELLNQKLNILGAKEKC